jgi:hypothetical protein
VLDALEMALHRRRPFDVIHHSDQGTQYTSIALGIRAREAGIQLSMGSVGDCYDNAMCESFFATLECELSGHLGGLLSGIHVKINVHDPRALSLHGVTIPDGLLPGIIDDYRTIPVTLTQTDGGKIGSVETDRVDLHVADPSANHGITEQIVYLSRTTHWPIRQIMYSGSQTVLYDSVNDLKLNVGLAQNDFPF